MSQYERMSETDRFTLLGTVAQDTAEAERAYVEWKEKIAQHVKALGVAAKALSEAQTKDHPNDGDEKAVSSAMAKVPDGQAILADYRKFAEAKTSAKALRTRLEQMLPPKVE